MKKNIAVRLVLFMFLFVMAGCATKIHLKDSEQILQLCDRTRFTLIIRQYPNKIRTIKGIIVDGNVRFKSKDLDIFDFSKCVRFTLMVNTPEDSDCPLRTGGYETEEIILKKISGDTYEVDLKEFKKTS